MYNEEENVKRTLFEVNSVMNDYSDYEILAVDDGSTDNTYSMLQELHQKIATYVF